MIEYVVLKVNTTGLEESDRVTEFSLYRCRDGVVVDKLCSLVNPQIPIPPEVESLSGISNDMVKDRPLFVCMKDSIISFIGDLPIVGHNTAFDLSFLQRELDHTFSNPVVDTLNLSRALLKLPSYKLQTVASYFHIQELSLVRTERSASLISQVFMKLLSIMKANRLSDEREAL